MPAEFSVRDNISERNEKLERLREEVEQTKALFEGARKAYDRALERSKDLGAAHPDGTIRHAARIYRHTLHNTERHSGGSTGSSWIEATGRKKPRKSSNTAPRRRGSRAS